MKSNNIPLTPLKLSFTDWLKEHTGRGERYCEVITKEGERILVNEKLINTI